MQVKEFNLSPDPISLKAGTKISYSAKFEVSQHTSVKYKVQLKVQKKAGWFWITIPCIGKVGSW